MISPQPVTVIPNARVDVSFHIGCGRDHLSTIHAALKAWQNNGCYPSYEKPLQELLDKIEAVMYATYTAELHPNSR